MESNSTFVIVYLQHRVYHKKHQWNTAKSVNKCARLDLVRQMFFRKPQLADIQRINFSPCKSGALDPIWRQKSPTFQNHNLLIPSSQTPALGEKPVNLSPFPIFFDEKEEREKEKTGHKKAEKPYCSKKHISNIQAGIQSPTRIQPPKSMANLHLPK